MKAKILEIRDEGTFISCLAIELLPDNNEQYWYLLREGYRTVNKNIMITALFGERTASCDPYHWESRRTWGNAHNYIIEHWDMLNDGDVVDVQYILKETATVKRSERFDRHE